MVSADDLVLFVSRYSNILKIRSRISDRIVHVSARMELGHISVMNFFHNTAPCIVRSLYVERFIKNTT